MNFPSAGWNKARGVGSENGVLQNSEAVARMLVSIGYRGEDIVQK